MLKLSAIKLGIADDETMLLSLSRVSYEKNIQAILKQFPEVLSENKRVKLVVVGDGPYLQDLKDLVAELGIEEAVIFTGMVPHDETALYYKASDFFISASTSETQGLTYTESLASGTPVIAHGNPYLDDIIDKKMFGTLFLSRRRFSRCDFRCDCRYTSNGRKDIQRKNVRYFSRAFWKISLCLLFRRLDFSQK